MNLFHLSSWLPLHLSPLCSKGWVVWIFPSLSVSFSPSSSYYSFSPFFQAKEREVSLLFLTALFLINSIICQNFENFLFQQSSYYWSWMCCHFTTSGILPDIEVIKEMISIRLRIDSNIDSEIQKTKQQKKCCWLLDRKGEEMGDKVKG